MDMPEWWEWELEISSHCLKRMQDRGFTEADLRAMLEDATDIHEQAHETLIIKTVHENRPWEVIVVPDYQKQLIVVVSAYPDT
jgi:hypothetical protein